MEEKDRIKMKLPEWVPCEKIEKLNRENKVSFLAFLDGLKENQAGQER